MKPIPGSEITVSHLSCGWKNGVWHDKPRMLRSSLTRLRGLLSDASIKCNNWCTAWRKNQTEHRLKKSVRHIRFAITCIARWVSVRLHRIHAYAMTWKPFLHFCTPFRGGKLSPIDPPYKSSVLRGSIFIDILNTLRPGQDGCQFPDDIFKYIFLNENTWISIAISLKFVLSGPINNIPALVQIMAWRRPGDKPLSEPMILSLPTHICVTRPQWVNRLFNKQLSMW